MVFEHVISQNAATIDATTHLPVPCGVKDLRSSLGLSWYYRRFIKNYARITAPLSKLITKERVQRFEWTNKCEDAFKQLQNPLFCAPELMHPNFNREFIVQTDAQDTGLGAILFQSDEDGTERPVAYGSKVFSPWERRYCTTEKEAFAVVFAVRTFQFYHIGRPFTIIIH